MCQAKDPKIILIDGDGGQLAEVLLALYDLYQDNRKLVMEISIRLPFPEMITKLLMLNTCELELIKKKWEQIKESEV